MCVCVRASMCNDMLGTTLSHSLTPVVQGVHHEAKLFEEVHPIVWPKDNQRTRLSSTVKLIYNKVTQTTNCRAQ